MCACASSGVSFSVCEVLMFRVIGHYVSHQGDGYCLEITCVFSQMLIWSNFRLLIEMRNKNRDNTLVMTRFDVTC